MVRADAYKRTVRFMLPGHGIVPLAQQDTALIARARATAAHYRKLAAQADKAVMQARMLGFAVKWEQRADAMEARRRGPQEKGELFA